MNTSDPIEISYIIDFEKLIKNLTNILIYQSVITYCVKCLRNIVINIYKLS
jgi:hypothetical protein